MNTEKAEQLQQDLIDLHLEFSRLEQKSNALLASLIRLWAEISITNSDPLARRRFQREIEGLSHDFHADLLQPESRATP